MLCLSLMPPPYDSHTSVIENGIVFARKPLISLRLMGTESQPAARETGSETGRIRWRVGGRATETEIQRERETVTERETKTGKQEVRLVESDGGNEVRRQRERDRDIYRETKRQRE